MPIISEKDFVKQVKNNIINNVMFLYGNEKYLINFYGKSITLKILDKQVNDLNFTEFDMENAQLEDIEKQADSISFFSTKKCIHLKYFEPSQFNKSKTDKLIEIFSNSPQTTHFIITIKNAEDNYKKDEKLQKFVKAFSKKFDCIKFIKKSKKDLIKFLLSKCKSHNVELSEQDAVYLIENCGEEIDTLTNEIDKLINFAQGGGNISKVSIEKICSFKTESQIFLMVADIINMREENAFKRLNNLFYNNEEPVAILSVIISSFIDLYRAKTALSSPEISNYENQIIEDFLYPKVLSFKIKNALRDSKNFSVKYLREVISLGLQADIQFKSTSVDNKIVLQTYITKIITMPKN